MTGDGKQQEARTFDEWYKDEGARIVRATDATSYEYMREAWNAAHQAPSPYTNLLDYKSIVMNWWSKGPAQVPEELISALNYAAVRRPSTQPLKGEGAWLDEIILCNNNPDKLRSVLRAFSANLRQQPSHASGEPGQEAYHAACATEIEIAKLIGEPQSGKYRVEIVRLLHKRFDASFQRGLVAGRAAMAEKAAQALKDHWLFAIECHHEAKTDQAVCACGLKTPERESVGKAVQDWIEHVLRSL